MKGITSRIIKLAAISLIGIFGLVILGYAELWGADWRILYKIESGPPEQRHQGGFFFDVESIFKTKEGYIRVWTKLDFAPGYWSFELVEINCSQKEFRTLSEHRVFPGGYKKEPPEREWDHISPGGTVERVYEIVCGK